NLLLFQYTGIHFNLRLDPFSIVIFIVKKFNKMAISLADFEKLFGGNFTNIVPGITKLPSFFISFVKVTHPSKCLSLFDEILIGVNSLLYNLILLSEMLSSSLEEVIQNRLKLLFNFRSEEHTSELQSRENLVCRLLLEKKKKNTRYT